MADARHRARNREAAASSSSSPAAASSRGGDDDDGVFVARPVGADAVDGVARARATSRRRSTRASFSRSSRSNVSRSARTSADMAATRASVSSASRRRCVRVDADADARVGRGTVVASLGRASSASSTRARARIGVVIRDDEDDAPLESIARTSRARRRARVSTATLDGGHDPSPVARPPRATLATRAGVAVSRDSVASHARGTHSRFTIRQNQSMSPDSYRVPRAHRGRRAARSRRHRATRADPARATDRAIDARCVSSSRATSLPTTPLSTRETAATTTTGPKDGLKSNGAICSPALQTTTTRPDDGDDVREDDRTMRTRVIDDRV